MEPGSSNAKSKRNVKRRIIEGSPKKKNGLKEGISDPFNIYDREGRLAAFRQLSIEDLQVQLKLAEEGTHPIILKYKEEFEKKTKEAIEKAEIQKMYALRRAQQEYEAREAKITEQTAVKLQELKLEMEKELELQEKRVENEYSCLDINKPTTSNVVEVTKKTLRGRGGVLVEPPTYFNATPKHTVISAQSVTKFLLDEDKVREDLKAIFSTMPQKSQKQYDVQLHKMRLVYEGKSFKQGEEVFVENMEFGKFSAKVENINESVASFRGTQSWDVRQIHASIADLKEGRVKLFKKKNN